MFGAAFQIAGAGLSNGDLSGARAAELISPELWKLPSVSDLDQFLFQTGCQPPLPVSMHMMQQLQQDAACQHLLHCFEAGTGMHALTAAVSSALEAQVWGCEEPWTSDIVNNTVLAMLQKLDRLLLPQLRLGFTVERNKGDSVSGMTAVMNKVNPLRPDGVIRHHDQIRMLLKWEEKGQGGLSSAVEDLRWKTVAWPDVYYGTVQYLLTFVAAGAEFQFCVLERSAVGSGVAPRRIGPRLCLNELAGKAQLVVASVQLYRLLVAMARAMPETLAPLGQLHKIMRDGITRTM